MGDGYWGYYESAKPREVKDGIKARSRRGAIGETWWSKRWIGLLESFGIGERLGRGRSYARKGQVISIDAKKGIVTAKVQGTRAKPYDVSIQLNQISKDDWDKATDAMASKAIFAAKLFSGEMPLDIEDAFNEAGVSLFPTSIEDINTDCSCPDWSNPCKHIAAVYYLLAESFDDDPFLIFKLRGRTREEIIDVLREKRAVAASAEEESEVIDKNLSIRSEKVKPLEGCLDSFWRTGDALDSFSVNPLCPDVENAILKRLGDAPFYIHKINLASLLATAYKVASGTALQKAVEEAKASTQMKEEK
ncbi:MAG: SWIM zinc finger protein [Candidatus Methanolliviera sp. GoM_asphalt]|nr:MAG: SWIM zinc finger protein [Candidatus Methanolliviera sp. GoM_asphalt]